MASNAPGQLPPQPVEADRTGNAVLIIVQCIFFAIATIVIFARFYVRSCVVKSLGLDELFIAFAWICSLVSTVLTVAWAHQRIKSVANGSPPIPEVFVALHAQVASQPPTLLSSTFTRMSFCFFLLRLFGHQRKWRISLWIIFALATITGIGTAIVVIPQCQPIKKIWAPLTPGTCWRPGIVLGIADFVGVFSVLIDWALATLPIAFLWNVKISLRAKIGICFLMSLGYFTGVCRIVVTILLNKIARNGGSGAITWTFINTYIWIGLKENLGIVCASLATLRPLFSKSIRKQSKKRSAGATPSYNYGHGQQPSSKNFKWKRSSLQPLSRNDEDKEYLNIELGSVTHPEPAASNRFALGRGDGCDTTETPASVGRESAHAIV